jgi:hypothetical protein
VFIYVWHVLYSMFLRLFTCLFDVLDLTLFDYFLCFRDCDVLDLLLGKSIYGFRHVCLLFCLYMIDNFGV